MAIMNENQEYGVAMGVKRGRCQESSCHCACYKAAEEEEGGVCLNCGHFPGNHDNLGLLNDTQMENGKIIYADSDPLGLLSQENQENISSDTRIQLEEMCEWSIGGNELKFLEKLGSGRSATVYKGLYKNITVAIKVLKESLEPKELANFKGELDIMQKVKSNHVVNFYGGCLQPKICLVMEYCSNGSLFHLLQRKEFVINWPMFFRLSLEMARGVHALHSMVPPVVHRDLKSLNLLVNSEYQVKVCDFGLSRYTSTSADDSTLTKLRGTFAYSAPEVYFGEKYSTKSDVFSIGVILWEVIARVISGEYQRPYKEFREIKIDFQIIIASAKKGKRPTIPPKTPQSLATLVTTCWDAKPENRPSVDGVLESLLSIESEYQANIATWDSILSPTVSASGSASAGGGEQTPPNNTNISIERPPGDQNNNQQQQQQQQQQQSAPQLHPNNIPANNISPNNMPQNNVISNNVPSHESIAITQEERERAGKSFSEQGGGRRISLSRSASKIFARKVSAVDDKKEDGKISVGQPQWQHRTAEELLGENKPVDDKKIEVVTGGWKHFSHDDWRSEDAFEDDKKKEKKKGGILGRLMKKDKKGKK